MKILTKLLHQLPPETAHNMALWGLKNGGGSFKARLDDTRLNVTVWGRTFVNPIGLAAGFDKNAVAVPALLNMGFGFVEVGTVTPLPQKGNPKPRLFRLGEDKAIINRMGFNNVGVEHFLKNLTCNSHPPHLPYPKERLGISIGPNKHSVQNGEDAVKADLTVLIEHCAPYAGYLAVNLSSPNTAGLRDLQHHAKYIASHCINVRNDTGEDTPLLMKLAPDLEPDALHAILDALQEAGIDGLIATNTTLQRPESLNSAYRSEQGGLSGRPLKEISTRMIADIHAYTKGSLPIIGVGGIETAQDIQEKMQAGAALVQIYTSFIDAGPRVLKEMKRGMLGSL